MVRQILLGAFANTAFCLFDPQGEKRISGSGRNPAIGLRVGRGRSKDDPVISKMIKIAANYTPQGDAENVVLQDFHSLRQALNVASADQRLLVVVNYDDKARKIAESNLQTVFADTDIIGKFHLVSLKPRVDETSAAKIKGFTNSTGISIVRSGKFGLDGTVMEKLPVTADAESIKATLLKANETFAELETRKVYSEHVKAGRQQRIYFENEIPYGEDRDGDGEIDKRGGRSK